MTPLLAVVVMTTLMAVVVMIALMVVVVMTPLQVELAAITSSSTLTLPSIAAQSASTPSPTSSAVPTKSSWIKLLSPPSPVPPDLASAPANLPPSTHPPTELPLLELAAPASSSIVPTATSSTIPMVQQQV